MDPPLAIAKAAAPTSVLLSICSEALVLVDEGYIMQHATPSFHTEFSLEPETAAGRPLSTVLPQLMIGAGLMQIFTSTQPLELHCRTEHRHYRVRGRIGVDGDARFLALAFTREGAAPEEGESEGLADPELEMRPGASASSDPLAPLAAPGAPLHEIPSPTATPPGTPSSPRQQRRWRPAKSGEKDGAQDQDGHALRDGGLASVAERAEKKRLEGEEARARRRQLAKGPDSEWLGNVSLMMRTHLNGIIGMHQLLNATALTVEQALYLHMIKSSAEILLNSITDLIDKWEIQTDTFSVLASQPDCFSLRACVEDSVDTIARSFPENPFDAASYIDPDFNWTIRGSPAVLKRILLKLAGFFAVAALDLGAILLATQQEDVTASSVTACFELRAFNPAGGSVELRPIATKHLEAWANGQESPKWSDQSFGLWLSRKLVEKIGGEVGVKDGGGTFCFRVPFERETSSDLDGVGPGPGVGLGDFIMKPSVLIVDALSPLRAMLRKYVEAWGFRAREVDSLQEAREELSTRYYTVVLINLQTKIMSGIHSPAYPSPLNAAGALPDGHNQALPEFNQVLDMKRDGGLMGVSVVVMSPFKQQQSLLKLKDPANEQGMWQVLTKPVSSHRLFKCLTEALSDDPKVSPSPVMRHGPSSLDRFCRHPPSQDDVRRVLIADDHPVNQKLVRWILEAAGMECDVANNGLDAVRIIEGFSAEYDLVLMDINMPGMSGIEAAERIRSFEQSGQGMMLQRRLPIVGMTAQNRSSHVQQYMDAGMDDFLTFPVDRENLLLKVQHWIDRTHEAPRPIIDLSTILLMCQGERHAMVNMLEEFVRMTAIQLGSLRNSLITDQHDMLFSGTEAIKCVATRFGAVWLAKSAFTFRRLVTESAGDKPMSTKLAALSRIEEELLLIGDCTTNIRLALDPGGGGAGGGEGAPRGLPVITEDISAEITISAEEALRDYVAKGGEAAGGLRETGAQPLGADGGGGGANAADFERGAWRPRPLSPTLPPPHPELGPLVEELRKIGTTSPTSKGSSPHAITPTRGGGRVSSPD